MPPKHRKRLVLLLLVLVTFIAGGGTVLGCVCPDGDNSALGKFESARHVVVNKLTSVNKPATTITSITTIVEKVYKGNIKAGDEMILGKQGWEIDVNSVFGARTSGRNEDDGSAQVQLKAGRHAYADFIFRVDNRLSGRVLDASGRPLPRVCLRLLPTQPIVSKYFKGDECADAGGRFEFEEIPFASYVIVINDDDKISSREPFRRFYYPDVTEREKAQVITIDEGVTEYLLDVHVPAVKEVLTVTGKVLSADGKPVVSALL